ncbi:RNA polymerase-associated protein RapA [bacterium HR36]|nr:RNA polymerase-associated protein RapA [bacterium HR36]
MGPISTTDSILGYTQSPASQDEGEGVSTVSFPLRLAAESICCPIAFDETMPVSQGFLAQSPCRARPVRLLPLHVTIRSYHFPLSEPSILAAVNPKNSPPGGQQSLRDLDSISPPIVRPSLPREVLRPQDRLLLLLQPPVPAIFRQRRLPLPAKPYPYQWQGIAFLLPRRAALLADEMGLGKTIQTILALRLLFHLGEVNHALIVCPKPLVSNWAKELQFWAPEIPFELISGDAAVRHQLWSSAVPIKLTNYETVTRDLNFLLEQDTRFDIVIADEAQRLKNPESHTCQALCALNR